MRLPRRILACTDLSACGDDAVAYAMLLAAKLDAEVVLVHLFDGFVMVQHELLRPTPAAVLEERVECGLGRLRELARRVGRRDVPVRFVCEHGDAHCDLMRIAEREGAELIVLGRYGHGSMFQRFAGSVADSVVNNATVPVLTVGDGSTVIDRQLARNQVESVRS